MRDAAARLSTSARLGRLLALTLLAAGLAGAGLFAAALAGRAREGQPAPAFTLVTPEGQSLSLAALRGHPVLLNFWATWCPPCRLEVYALESFHRRYAPHVEVVGVDVGESAAVVRDFARRFGVTYRLALDPTQAVKARYAVRGLPESWWVDAAGVARLHHPGPARFEDLVAQLQRVAPQAAATARAGGPPGGILRAAAWAPGGEGVVVLTDGLYVGGGGRWRPVPLPGDARAADLAGTAGAVHVLLEDGRVLRWTGPEGPRAAGGPLPAGAGRARVLAVDPGDGRRLAVWAEGSGLWRSDDGGATWTLAAPLAPPGGVTALAFDPDAPGGLWAGTPAGLLASGDGGRTWWPSQPAAANPDPEGLLPWEGRFARPVYDLALLPGGRAYLATDLGIWALGGDAPARLLPRSPARVLVALAAPPGTRGPGWLAAAPDGDLYAGDPAADWAPLRP